MGFKIERFDSEGQEREERIDRQAAVLLEYLSWSVQGGLCLYEATGEKPWWVKEELDELRNEMESLRLRRDNAGQLPAFSAKESSGFSSGQISGARAVIVEGRCRDVGDGGEGDEQLFPLEMEVGIGAIALDTVSKIVDPLRIKPLNLEAMERLEVLERVLDPSVPITG